MPQTNPQRVATAKLILAAGKVHHQGCSELVCEALGIPWQDANSLLGDNPTEVGKDNDYHGLTAGDVVGWRGDGRSGHVSIFIGEENMKFIDVREPGAAPRKVGYGYGAQKLYKSTRY